MNKEQTKNIAICLAVGVVGISLVVMALTIISSENQKKVDVNEFEFLKAFASYHIDESDPDWECKKTVGLYELAKQSYPHFEKNTKWLADLKCGFDVGILTP